MASNYVISAFTLRMHTDDAEMIGLAERASELLVAELNDGELKLAFHGLGERFAAMFPADGPNHFGSFLRLFDNPGYPMFDCDVTVTPAGDDGWCTVFFFGYQFGVGSVARLIFAACKSALPCTFSWALTCDRLRPSEFGGGCAIITEAGIDFHTTTGIIDRTVQRLAFGKGEALHGLVLAKREAINGMDFWNTEAGFGPLASATVFSETAAAHFEKPAGHEDADWLTLPAPLPA
ncbi:hypothetical protein [uncultured Novosphingobium sp.]|uniref:hypothetical protein n=1 Tax=uncultured Novosphingobium sp. TaxID=292277 RepID=UPI00259697AF|nr:hypothetical protein [uncultured Novosphingobium sp.]